MNAIDQNNAILSLNKALVPGPFLIDGRTERDHLSFMADFASLINFYDSENNINGNWTPFLLKDPVFLLAQISKTDFAKHHSLYINTCSQIEAMVSANPIKTALIITMDQLFDQLSCIFMTIQSWTHYMQKTDIGYKLKTYVLNKVKTVFSECFWAFVTLRDGLSSLKSKHKIKPVQYYLFDRNEDGVWNQNKNKRPYWDVLGLQHPISKNKPTDIYNALKKAGDDLFSFFQTIVNHSVSEFEAVKALKCKFPDTTLLRAFVNLLGIHREQLNGISQKHLEFYYSDVLKQTKQPAKPDSVFICTELVKKDAVFTLPAGTLFNAGADAQKNPVLFATQQDVSLNPATITGGYTLVKMRQADNSVMYGLKALTDTGKIQQDQNGKIQGWKTFGDAAATGSVVVMPGIAIASPMLLLREGTRSITLSFGFSGKADTPLFNNVTYYLSTKTGWLELVGSCKFDISMGLKIISIIVDPAEQPIEQFLKAPDGLDNTWPMVKIEFNTLPDAFVMPVIESLTIMVDVQGVRTFQLYNDYGALSTKAPYQPFGPTPLFNSNFIIGNNEVFSKPLQSLLITLNWNNLPADFAEYYQLYNDYLAGELNPPDKKQPGAFARLWAALLIWLHITKKSLPAVPDPEFANASFTADFKLLQNNNWMELIMTDNPLSIVPNVTGAVVGLPPAVIQQVKPINYLFNNKVAAVAATIPGTDIAGIGNTSSFNYAFVPPSQGQASVSSVALPGIADPSIQNIPFKYTDTSLSGFMKIVLTGNPYGFGSQLYPQLVAQTALYNSWILYNKDTDVATCQAANLPIAPRMTNFTANYSASQVYNFDSAATDYPVQFFACTPFVNHIVYDSSKPVITTSGNSANPLNNLSFTLFPQSFLSSDGFLFLGLDDLIPSNSINLYFELATNYTAAATVNNTLNCYYLNNTGWRPLTVLADETNNFNCSGIVSVNVPWDITSESPLMPGNKFWFCLSVTGDPASVADTVFLKTNGFLAHRSGSAFLNDNQSPQIGAAIITKPQVAISQIAAVTQPFPSFGGKAAEDYMAMSRRSSNRLKTKDRAVTSFDYFRLIKQEYPDVFYSKSIFNSQTNNIEVYLVRGYANYGSPGAFRPMLSVCRIEAIQAFLQQRISGFSTLVVSNFNFSPINIAVAISLTPAFKYKGAQVKKSIGDALNIFLSPWIASSQPQISMDQGINEGQVIKFIKGIQGVADVKSLSISPFSNWQKISPGTLLISGMDHKIDVTGM